MNNVQVKCPSLLEHKPKHKRLFRYLFKKYKRTKTSMSVLSTTSMSVLSTAGPKCVLATSHAALWWVTVSMLMGQTDGQMPDHYTTRST